MGQYDRNRDAERRFMSESRGARQWRDDNDFDFRREDYGRSKEPPRDDRGRFMSEGENGDYYGGRHRGYEGDYRERDHEGPRHGGREVYGGQDDGDYRQGRGGEQGYEDYDNGYRSGGRGDDHDRGYVRHERGTERDEYGRFTSDDDDHRGGFSRGGRHDADNERVSRGRESGQGRGWFGDPRGHAEAARERWQESRGSRYENDDDRDSRGSHPEDRDRDEYGRFASADHDNRGRGSPDHGGIDHRGWYGDSRGHAQAARLGWRHRQR